jgi:hypothetical protein
MLLLDTAIHLPPQIGIYSQTTGSELWICFTTIPCIRV